MSEEVKKEYEPLCRLPKVEKPDEYRIGEHKPPGFLLFLFAMVFVWAMISWVPFFGY